MIMVQRFDVTQLDDQDSTCYLERDGQHFAMTPMRPNGLALAVTPPQGLEGQTIYLGNGEIEPTLNQAASDTTIAASSR